MGDDALAERMLLEARPEWLRGRVRKLEAEVEQMRPVAMASQSCFGCGGHNCGCACHRERGPGLRSSFDSLSNQAKRLADENADMTVCAERAEAQVASLAKALREIASLDIGIGQIAGAHARGVARAALAGLEAPKGKVHCADCKRLLDFDDEVDWGAAILCKACSKKLSDTLPDEPMVGQGGKNGG